MRTMTARVRETLWTAGDLLRAGFEYRRHELWDGVPVVKEPAGGWSSFVGVHLAARLAAYVVPRRLGCVGESSAGYFVSRAPDRVLSPDVSFVSRERLRAPPAAGYVPLSPDFVVEVKSPTDSWVSVVERGGVWIGHGVRLVWLVDPPKKTVLVLVPGREPVPFGPGTSLSGAPVLPRFRLRVDDLFEGLSA